MYPPGERPAVDPRYIFLNGEAPLFTMWQVKGQIKEGEGREVEGG